ncbi:hypothetical protein HGRIS_008105 [Hohenbuehelia grisea]|uniref:Uncharacterized protein n=1 Tax=Hohenbuehelia grisea TaxID=104357 RepID=A0ABR3J7F6_9AGAR
MSAPISSSSSGTIGDNALGASELQAWLSWLSERTVWFEGHGWLGYEKLTKTVMVEGCATMTQYHQDFPFVGQAVQVEKVDVSGSTEAARVLPWLESGSVDEQVARGRYGEIFIRNQLKCLV